MLILLGQHDNGDKQVQPAVPPSLLSGPSTLFAACERLALYPEDRACRSSGAVMTPAELDMVVDLVRANLAGANLVRANLAPEPYVRPANSVIAARAGQSRWISGQHGQVAALLHDRRACDG